MRQRQRRRLSRTRRRTRTRARTRTRTRTTKTTRRRTTRRTTTRRMTSKQKKRRCSRLLRLLPARGLSGWSCRGAVGWRQPRIRTRTRTRRRRCSRSRSRSRRPLRRSERRVNLPSQFSSVYRKPSATPAGGEWMGQLLRRAAVEMCFLLPPSAHERHLSCCPS